LGEAEGPKPEAIKENEWRGGYMNGCEEEEKEEEGVSLYGT